MMDYLRSLASSDMEHNQKKRRYYLVMNFMDFVHNFDLELTLFFNFNYQVDFSLQSWWITSGRETSARMTKRTTIRDSITFRSLWSARKRSRD